MDVLDVELYKNEVKKIADKGLEWNKLKNTTVLITGATGMLGRTIVDVIMYKNETDNLNCRVIAVARNYEKAQKRFIKYINNSNLIIYQLDINNKIGIEEKSIDYIFHLASPTHPAQYAEDPISTVTANVIATYNLLELASKYKAKRFIFASTVEVYGENRGDTEKFDENYCGYINCNTVRSGYPEGKRTGEALCQAYIKQKGLDIVIPRIPRTFGPSMLMSDSKASAQFIIKAMNNEDIILKSEGNQYYSYGYSIDVVYALFCCLFNGVCGEAYNIADEKFDITLKGFAEICANYNGRKVVIELPSETEKKGYSNSLKAILNGEKIKQIGWSTDNNIKDSIIKTIEILKNV